MSSTDHPAPQPYWNPYLAGFGVGLSLLAAFVFMGRGLGASGAFAAVTGAGVSAVAPEWAKHHAYFSDYASGAPLREWLVFEVMGVFLGGLVSGLLANRTRFTVEHGPQWTRARRFTFALAGGVVMAFGAKIAGGCTSGQGLTGGALLNAGSWAFLGSMFAGAYGVAWFVRKQWVPARKP